MLVQGIAGMLAHLMLQDLFDGNQAWRHGQRCEVQASNLQACVTLNVELDMLNRCVEQRKQPDSMLAKLWPWLLSQLICKLPNVQDSLTSNT